MGFYAEIALLVLGAIAVLWIIISASGTLSVLTFAKVRLDPFEDEEARTCLHNVLSRGMVDGQWLRTHKFHAVGVYHVRSLLGAPKLVAWKREGEATYLCIYVLYGTRTEMDLVTVFGDRVLTTGSAKDGQLLPIPPDNWMQTFSVSTASDLWGYHVSALDYVFQTTGLRPSEPESDLAEDFVRAIVKQGEYIRSLPLWPLRMPIWYFVRRNVRHSKTVRQLTEGRSSVC